MEEFLTDHAAVVIAFLSALLGVTWWFVRRDITKMFEDVEWLKGNCLTKENCQELRNQCIGRECVDSLAIRLDSITNALQMITLYSDTIDTVHKAEILSTLSKKENNQ